MPMYDYVCALCEEDGKFESIENISSRDFALCPKCGSRSPSAEIQGVNKFLAKTKYIVPGRATRKFGDKNMTPTKRARWV